MKFDANKIIDVNDFFNERKCKRCSKSLDNMRSDAIYCSRNCKSIVRKCNKSRQNTINKWKSKQLEQVNSIIELKKLLEGGK